MVELEDLHLNIPLQLLSSALRPYDTPYPFHLHRHRIVDCALHLPISKFVSSFHEMAVGVAGVVVTSYLRAHLCIGGPFPSANMPPSPTKKKEEIPTRNRAVNEV